ncbi:MAG: DsbA family protein [Actinomycetota bacterium]|nr:DsbA family protein [Actinomycetota bacterium]
MMYDVDFFFDPVCPWAWITSRWVSEVASLRSLEVNWKFISLSMVNSERDYQNEFPAGHNEIHILGLNLLRIAGAVRDEAGNSAVGRFYTDVGTSIHAKRKREEFKDPGKVADFLSSAGYQSGLIDAMADPSRDRVIEEETKLALDRAGRDIGTPVITFAPPDGPSFFGPVISRIPRGEDALALWEATERLALFPGFAELKRSVRESPQVV